MTHTRLSEEDSPSAAKTTFQQGLLEMLWEIALTHSFKTDLSFKEN